MSDPKPGIIEDLTGHHGTDVCRNRQLVFHPDATLMQFAQIGKLWDEVNDMLKENGHSEATASEICFLWTAKVFWAEHWRMLVDRRALA